MMHVAYSVKFTLCVCVNKKKQLIFLPLNICIFKRHPDNGKRKRDPISCHLPLLLLFFDQFLAGVLRRIALVWCQLYGEGQQMADGPYCFGKKFKGTGTKPRMRIQE